MGTLTAVNQRGGQESGAAFLKLHAVFLSASPELQFSLRAFGLGVVIQAAEPMAKMAPHQ